MFHLWTYDYTAPDVMLLMRADPFGGQEGGDWVLEIETFMGPKWLDAVSHHRAQTSLDFKGPTPSHLPS
jgi:hypothetical protein